MIGFGKGVSWKRGLLEKGSLQKNPFSTDPRKFREFRDSREPPDCGKQRRIQPFSRESRESLEILEILEIPPVKRPLSYPLIQNDYRQEKLFSNYFRGLYRKIL